MTQTTEEPTPTDTFRYALHFGIYPDRGTEGATPGVTVDPQAGSVHTDASTEVEMVLGLPADRCRAFVSGSWGCWVPAGQDTDGDGTTLHVVVFADSIDSADIVAVVAQVAERCAPGSVLGAVMVTSDAAAWSGNQVVRSVRDYTAA